MKKNFLNVSFFSKKFSSRLSHLKSFIFKILLNLKKNIHHHQQKSQY
jgi:hypothetical protein